MSPASRWGAAWLSLTIALALHVWDEAAHDFLALYNPTVVAIRSRFPFLPLPTFSFGFWLGGLCAAVAGLLLLSPLAFRGKRWMRFLAYPYSVLMLLNGLQHLAGSVYFGRLLAGAISSPLLIAASIALFTATRRAERSRFADAN